MNSSIILIFFTLGYVHSLTELPYSSFQNVNSNDQEGWNIVNKISATTDSWYRCGGSSIFGGYQIFGNLTIIIEQLYSITRFNFYFSKYVYHYIIQNYFLYQLIQKYRQLSTFGNDWGSSGQIILFIDDQKQYTDPIADISGTDQCGGTSKDKMININKTINHNFKTALIVIFTSFTSATGFWGINDFNFYIERCPIGCIICNAGDNYMNCQFWTLSYESLIGISQADFKTEGWQVTNMVTNQNIIFIATITNKDHLCVQIFPYYVALIYAQHILKLKFIFDILKLIYWDGEQAKLIIDNIQKWSKSYSYQDGYQICGRTNHNWNELGIFIEQNIPHNKKQLSIEITSGLNQGPGDESFGLRDVQLFIYNKCDQLYYDECCGDQYKSYDEDCDDGNINPFDGCHNCRYTCVEGCELCIKGICYACLKGWMYNEFFYICELDNIVQNKQAEYLIPRLCSENCQICIQSLCLQCFNDYYCICYLLF